MFTHVILNKIFNILITTEFGLFLNELEVKFILFKYSCNSFL